MILRLYEKEKNKLLIFIQFSIDFPQKVTFLFKSYFFTILKKTYKMVRYFFPKKSQLFLFLIFDAKLIFFIKKT